jgi:PhnB protein
MTVRLNPYLSFRDNARDALERYHAIFGGELTISTFGEMHGSDDPAEAEKVMHGMIDAGPSLVLMCADTPNSMELASGSAHAVSLSGDDDELLRGWWNGLLEGATFVLPLERAPWGDSFGMCTDRFGVSWMVNITAAPA